MAEQDNLYKAPQSEVLNTQSNQDNLTLQEPKKLTVGYGWSWISDAFELFKLAPMTWIGITIIYFICFLVVSLIPIAGNFLPSLLGPILMAGFILGCHGLKNNETLTIGHLFAGFKNNVEQLLLIGLFYMILIIVAMLPLIVMMGSMFFELLSNADNPEFSPEFLENPNAWMKILLGGLVSMAISVPVVMTIWFAPALASLHGLAAIEAMKLSFKGCLRNIMPFLWYGIIMLVFMMLATIPLGLGWLILTPLMICSLYASYRTVFTDEH